LFAGIGLGARSGLSKSFGPGIIAAAWFDAAIAGRLGLVIIAELGEPVLHLGLGPAVFLQRAGVALANHDPHVRSPFSRRVSPVQLANPCFNFFHVSNIKLQMDKAKINIRSIRHSGYTACG
jgi:hypothetical protein